MKSPSLIEFSRKCLIVLKSNLLAVAPQEGCALLVGDQQQAQDLQGEHFLRIQMIWPCCNIWQPGIFNIAVSEKEPKETFRSSSSRENRFAIDPREQLHAQRWARSKNWNVLGSAHSHPSGESEPSSIDLSWVFNPGLMVIVDKDAAIQAWWMVNREICNPLKVAYLDCE